DLMDLDDIRMVQARDRLRLCQKASVLPHEDHLQGDEAIQPQMPGLVHDAHPALPEHLKYLVPCDRRQVARRWTAGEGGGSLILCGRPPDRLGRRGAGRTVS